MAGPSPKRMLPGRLAVERARTSSALSPDLLAGLPLTRREREVLAWVAAGKTNGEIAAILGPSRRTIEKHLEHVFTKLGVETRTAAVMRALSGGHH